MKRNGLLWLLMLALIVPALALSGCKENKHHRDKDDDESSSRSTEKVEKKKMDNVIYGKYELDKESVRVLFGDAMESTEGDLAFRLVLTFEDDNKFRLNYITDASNYDDELESSMVFHVDVLGKGTWEFDDKDKILSINTVTSNLDNFDFHFSPENEKTQAFIDENGGPDVVMKDMEYAFMGEFDPNDFCIKREFKITELVDDGFCARTIDGDIMKVRFIRVD